MQLVTLDFETYYDVGFSLSGLTTEEYIRDARFQVIGVAIKIDEAETYWVTGSYEVIQEALNKIDWKNSALLCHNTQFDGAILAFRFGIIPGLYLDTLSMARATNGVEVGGSLGYLVEHYDLGVKGTEVVQAKGKRLEDFSHTELSAYAGYCVNDVNLTYKLFGVLAPKFPQSEIDLIDLTLRMYTEPLLEVDDALLQARLEEVQQEKSELLQGLMVKLECETEECVRAKLASNKQFAEILQELGVIVPTKISPATGKETFALAKGDQGFLDLCEHEDPFIQQLCTVRLGTKSTIEESRIERFIGIGGRNKGKLPIPLKYYGAHTGRWAGSDKVNFQNLPARDAKKKALKNAVIAPDGHKVINADSSQIEARVLVWLAGQNDVVQWYKEERDVYCEFATTVYERPITKANKIERAVGKTCILGLGYGTGWAKLQQTLKLAAGVELDERECKRLVSVYRNINSKVIDLWRECEEALRDIASWPDGKEPYPIGQHNALYATPQGIKLPNGLYIKYPGLTWDTSEAKSKFVYKSRRGFISIWGGSVVENVVQALARIIIGEQMLKINEKYRPVLTVHDAVVNVIPEAEIDDAMKFIIDTMSTPPDWATTLPVACEAHFGDSYGDC
jgi:DNA polymerase I-like protein with 3'-5' exonuclease and polymerase domains